MKKNVFVDAYLFNNLGDDLFMDVLASRYPETRFTCISRYYKPVTENVTVVSNKILEKVLGLPFLHRQILKKSDLAILIGGSMFIENESDDSSVFQSGKDIYILGVNFGPYQTDEFLNRYKKLFLKAKDLCFRDRQSYELFKTVPPARNASDILFSLPTPDLTEEKKVFISVMNPKKNKEIYKQFLLQQAEFFHSKGFEIVLGSFCKIQKDTEACEELKALLPFNVRIVSYEGNRNEILREIASSQKVIATRFHALVLGLLMKKEVLPIIYSVKTKNLLDDLNLKDCGIDLEDLNSESPKVSWAVLDDKQLNDLKKSSQKQFEKLDQILS